MCMCVQVCLRVCVVCVQLCILLCAQRLHCALLGHSAVSSKLSDPPVSALHSLPASGATPRFLCTHWDLNYVFMPDW